MMAKPEHLSAARPYAKAIFDQALEDKALSSWQDVLEACVQVMGMPPMDLYRQHPLKDDHVVAKILIQSVQDKSIPLSALLDTLIASERLAVLPAIHELYVAHVDAYHKRLTAKVSCAYPLALDEQKTIESFIKKRYQVESVVLQMIIDKTIMGGVDIYVQDDTIRYSLSDRFNRLRQSFRSQSS